MIGDGAVILNKERGFTSLDAVAVLRGITGQRKIGHTGTLDPQAEGVLVCLLGKATRAAGMDRPDAGKEYIARMLLGRRTDTEDIWGSIIEEKTPDVSESDVREALGRFTGSQMQVPPAYSALKINGRRSYDLARSGQKVAHEARPVMIHEIEVLSADLPEVTFRVSCSAGTYIRSLCRDAGDLLGCGACMSGLTRTRSGAFTLDQARRLDELQEMKGSGRLEDALIPLGDLFADLPLVRVTPGSEKYLLNGNALHPDELTKDAGSVPGRDVRVCLPDGTFKAIYTYRDAQKEYRVLKMF